MPTSSRPVLLLVAAAVLWSSGGLLLKSVEWNSIAIAGARSLIAAAVILAFLGRPRRPRLEPALIGAVLAYAGTVVFFVLATRATTAANAILIQYTAPLWVALLGPWYLGEKSRAVDWMAIGGIAVGLLLFFRDELAPGHLEGNLFAVAAGMCFGGFVLFSRKQTERPPLTAILLGNVLAGIVCAPAYFSGPWPDAQAWGLLVALGVVQLGLSYVCFARAIAHVPAVQSILVLSLEPILNPVWVFLVLGETPGTWAIAGGSLVLVSVTARALARSRPPVPVPD